MRRMLLRIMRLARRRSAWVMLLVLSAVRIVEGATVLVEAVEGGLSACQALALANNPAVAGFVLLPLFCATLPHSVSFVLSDSVMARIGSHLRHVLFCVRTLAFEAVLFSAAISITAFALVVAFFGVSSELALSLVESFVLQSVFLTTAGMICLCTMAALRSSAISYALVLIYGLWDFVAGSAVGGWLPYLGWGMTLVSHPYVWQGVAAQGLLLVAQLLTLGSAAYVLAICVGMSGKRRPT